ncbi:homing endonuclease associated repeat-containing protein [Haladaptatus sp. YSMS36]|uniref:homing endonuclease associated repeat-containing protein n=1 Tax=Haladaptatus sp. YSMS36 TaxID=3033384 RepID=UPI0023E8E1F1|nr:helix-hairpin-helix domain-containing protein [Haladaptatus sp. YSMS36]
MISEISGLGLSPRAVYRRLLLAHQHLCTGFERTTTSNESISPSQIAEFQATLQADIQTVERYATLIKNDLPALEALTELVQDTESSPARLTESKRVQLHDFLTNFNDLPSLKLAPFVDEVALDEFAKMIEESIESPTEDISEADPRAEMLELILSLHEELGRIPKATHLPKAAPYTSHDFVMEFGGWYDAVEEAGLDLRKELLAELTAYGENLEGPPLITDFAAMGKYNQGDVYTVFDTWSEAKAIAGITNGNDATEKDSLAADGKDTQDDDTAVDDDTSEIGRSHDQTTKEDVLNSIREVTVRLDRIPTASEFVRQSNFFHSDIESYFEDWESAVEGAGLDYKQEIIDDINSVANTLGRFPSPLEYSTKGKYRRKDVYNHFRSWGSVIDALERPQSTPRPERHSLLNYLKRLVDELGRIPKGKELPANGPYEYDQIIDEFGDWDAAIAAAGFDHRQEVLDDLRRVKRELGHPPSKEEFERYGNYAFSDVFRHFHTIDAANEAAKSEREPEIESYELAERYELFRRLHRVVSAIIKATEVEDENSTISQWRDTLHEFLNSGCESWEAGYGQQQLNQTEVKMSDYREAYGDGKTVTVFNHVEVAKPDAVVAELLTALELDEDVSTLRFPVIPHTGEPLPVFVESTQALVRAREALSTFPEEPEGPPVTGVEALCQIAGVLEADADALYAAGFTSIEDLRAASIDEIAAVDEIGTGLALRIKADVGG